MDIFKIVGVGILGVITAGFIKSAKSEFSVFVVLATGLGLCRGKKLYDKRETEAKKQAEREIDRYERESRK